MSELFPDEVLRQSLLAYHGAKFGEGYAAMRAVLEGHLAEQERALRGWHCLECGRLVDHGMACICQGAASVGSPR